GGDGGLLNPAPGDDGDGDDYDDDHDRGGDGEEDFVDVGGAIVFLEDEFQSIGERLEKAHGPDAIGAKAILHPAGDLAFQQDQVGDGAEGDAVHDEGDPDPGGDTLEKLEHMKNSVSIRL